MASLCPQCKKCVSTGQERCDGCGAILSVADLSPFVTTEFSNRIVKKGCDFFIQAAEKNVAGAEFVANMVGKEAVEYYMMSCGKTAGQEVAEQTVAKTAIRLSAAKSTEAVVKGFAKGATTNWNWASTFVEMGTQAALRSAGCSKTTACVVSKVMGLTTALVVGGAVGGPIGMAGSATSWVFGEGVSLSLDAVI